MLCLHTISTQFRLDTSQRQSTYGLEMEGAQRAFITVMWIFFKFFFFRLPIAIQDPYENNLRSCSWTETLLFVAPYRRFVYER